MIYRRINALLVLFSLVGGVIGFVLGEVILTWGEGRISNVWLIAIYFAQFALIVALMCLLAEMIAPDLNGRGWRSRYVGQAWKMLIPSTVLLLFLTGAILQFIYGLNFGSNQPPQEITLLMDISGSMQKTDPDKESFKAANDLITKMDTDKRVSIITFNQEADLVQPFIKLSDQSVKDGIFAKLDTNQMYDGETNISLALGKAMEQIQSTVKDKRKSMVILMSDGYSEMNLNTVLAPFIKDHIAINTVAMYSVDGGGRELLKLIANKTGGQSYNVEDVMNLSDIFNKIYSDTQSHHLLGERVDQNANSILYSFLRIFFVTLFGAFLGLSLGIIFDNRFLAKSFVSGGIIAGVLAGIVLEFGLRNTSVSAVGYRAIADLLLALVISLSTLGFAYKQGNNSDISPAFNRTKAASSGSGKYNDNSKGFH